mmetsp:Transcript_31284/g.99805  ORF Transcript_31284/g.99805 Transcript_31284/m.99805 type:complete len:88 (-) Transcript_31284:10-273(-)
MVGVIALAVVWFRRRAMFRLKPFASQHGERAGWKGHVGPNMDDLEAAGQEGAGGRGGKAKKKPPGFCILQVEQNRYPSYTSKTLGHR